MPDTDYSPNPDPDESSPVSASDIVSLEPASSQPNGASTGSLLVLEQGLEPSSEPGLVRSIKQHGQILSGVLLGTAATLLLGQLQGAAPESTTYQGLALREHLDDHAGGLAFNWISQESDFVSVATAQPGDVQVNPNLSPQFTPQLHYIDRYYFAGGAPLVEQAQGVNQPSPGWFMVDRFYFFNSLAQGSGPYPEPVQNQPAFSTAAELPLPPSQLPSGEAFQGILEVPPPPGFALSAEPQTVTFQHAYPSFEAPQSTSSIKGRHTLLGIIATNNFGAALVKTNDRSYSVRVGQTLRQSSYSLVELDQDKAIFSDGQNQFGVSVGEAF
jgi:hypothetical protein